MSEEGSQSIEFSLIDGVRAERADARGELYELCIRVVYPWLRRKRHSLKLNEHDLDDIARNVATRVLESFHQFQRKPPVWTFSKWLQTITQHEITNYYRVRGGAAVIGGSSFHQFSQNIPDPVENCSVEEWQLERIEQMDLVVAALKLLKASHRRINATTWESFERTAVHGEPVDAVAVALSIKPELVRKHKERVFKLLKEHLNGLLD